MHVCACNVCSRRCGNVRRTRMAGMAVMTKTQAAMPSRKQPPPMSRPARLAAAACARAAGTVAEQCSRLRARCLCCRRCCCKGLVAARQSGQRWLVSAVLCVI